jgi:phage baseplate assembly protein gpV
MSRTEGVVVGQVKDVEDPAGEGRIRVEFPWLGGRNASDWAPHATLMAGGKRGSWFMPEVGDEVLVAFDHGDVDHPFIIGFLWNGADKPPTDDDQIDAEVRRLRTVKGHTLDFDDRDDSEQIVLTTHGKHVLELVDAPSPSHVTVTTTGGHKVAMVDDPGSVHVTTDGGQKVLLDDQPGSVHVETTGGQKLHLDDQSSSAHLETSGGQKLELDPSSATLTTAGGTLKINDAPASATLDSAGHHVELGVSGVTIRASSGAQVVLGPSGVQVTAPASLSISCLSATVSALSLSVAAPFTSFAGVVQVPTLIATSVVGTAYTPGAGNLV